MEIDSVLKFLENGELRLGSPTEIIHETEEENYLRAILLKLGVGSDGYLNLEGLTKVCEHIGMEMSEEVWLLDLF